MICGVLCVGTELLLGQIQDTNSVFIGEQLANAGIDSYEHRRVGDNPERIAQAVTSMLETCDSLIVTGGLGPTHDDITREVLADVMGVEIEVNQDVVREMRKFFKQRDREMTENNIRQAGVPVGATLLRNPLGTAPGLKCPVEVNGVTKYVYLTPGVPHEMQYLMTEYVLPDLISRKENGYSIVTKTLKTWGYGESFLAQMLDDIVQEGINGEVKVGFLARGMNGIYVKLSASDKTQVDALKKIEPVQRRVEELLGDAVYAYDEQTMESVVIELLRETNNTLSIAESFTGGLIAARLVEVSGASDVLTGAIVAYDEKVKREILGVTAKDIYSHECAKQMAQGVNKNLSTTIGLSTTGVAGPYSVDQHQPGEIYIGLSNSQTLLSEEFNLGGDRQRVREYGTITALNLLRKSLLGL